MQTTTRATPTTTELGAYARPLAASKKARFDLDGDVFRERVLDANDKFLPDGLTLVECLVEVSAAERRFVSQIQGRTYANIFGLVERFINAKVLELSQAHSLGDQVALEALVRFSDEELKHQEMFRRLEAMAARVMPPGYSCQLDPDEVARTVLGKSTWAVLALTCHIELFTQVHYKESIERDSRLSPLFRDVFRFHFMEESQHAVLDELEWRRIDQALGDVERSRGVTDLLDLVAAVDALLEAQARADSAYFFDASGRNFDAAARESIAETFLRAYRHQYIGSGVKQTRFASILQQLVGPTEWRRIERALAPWL